METGGDYTGKSNPLEKRRQLFLQSGGEPAAGLLELGPLAGEKTPPPPTNGEIRHEGLVLGLWKTDQVGNSVLKSQGMVA